MELQNIFFAIILFSTKEMFDFCFEGYDKDSKQNFRYLKLFKKHMPDVASSYRMRRKSLDKKFLFNIYLIVIVTLIIYFCITSTFGSSKLPQTDKLLAFHEFAIQGLLAFFLVASKIFLKSSFKSYQEQKFSRNAVIEFICGLMMLCLGITFVMFG